MLRDAIDDAQIEIRESILNKMDSLSSDIEGKGKTFILITRDYEILFSRDPLHSRKGFCFVSRDAGCSGLNTVRSW